MINFFNKLFHFSLIAIFTITLSAEYKLGVDYKLVDNPLPIKRDGIVEVTESFWYGCYGCYGPIMLYVPVSGYSQLVTNF